ncbi:MAG: NrsF family protein [Hyphomonadaceae bacterium]
MKTDDLIEALARNESAAERPRRTQALIFTLIDGLACALLIVAGAGFARPDLAAALMPVMAKAAFAAAFAAAALPLMLRLAQPGRPWRRALTVALGLLLASLIVAAIAMFGADPADRMRAWMGGGAPWCVVFIPILALPAAAALLAFVRNLAPTNLIAAGAAIGAVAGGVGAMAYALYCPVDSVAFVTTWYAAGIALSAVIGALVGAKFLRW